LIKANYGSDVIYKKVGRFVLAERKAHSVDLKIGKDFKPVRGDV
jgi:hypothetical protein